MRSKEELKQIFLRQAEFILDNKLDVLNNIVNNIPNNEEVSKENYNTVLDIAKSLRELYNITDKEFDIIHDNLKEWQHDLLPLILNRLTLH